VIVAATTAAIVVLVVFGLFVLLVLFAGGRLIWGLFRGDTQIEPGSWGRQYSRRGDDLDGEPKRRSRRDDRGG
jgi:hypothetical protein